MFNYNSLLYAVLYLLLILAFNYFYVAIQYNPVEIANNLRKNNGAIPGIRPGKPTSDFITKCLSKITFVGGQRGRHEHPAGRYQPADRCGRGSGHRPQHGKLYADAPSQGLLRVMKISMTHEKGDNLV